jgi:hypothetical protein
VVGLAALVAGTVTVVCYGSFFLWGEVNTFEFSWVTSNRVGLREVVGPGPSDWVLRVAQGAAAVAVGCCVALRRRGSPLTVVLCVMSTRLLLDPLMLPYYFGPLVAVALLWGWASRARPVRRAALAATVLVPAHVVVPFFVDTPTVQLGYLVLILAVPVLALVCDSGRTPGTRGRERAAGRDHDVAAVAAGSHLARPDRTPAGVVRAFERTVGDEVQCLLDDADVAVDVALAILRRGGWSVGIGCGVADTPLPASARAASGTAFVLARDAVEAAKRRSRPVPLGVRGEDAGAAADAEGVLVLVAATAARRTTAGWAVVDALGPGGGRRQDAVAAELGITQQAVSQRLRTALWHEELAARPAAARLLRLAAASSGAPGSR